jgi:Inorganic pyrophosphatase
VAEGEPNFDQIQDLDQLPEHLLAELENFFDVYKMLEPRASRPPTATSATRPPETGPVNPQRVTPLARCSTVMPSYHT